MKGKEKKWHDLPTRSHKKLAPSIAEGTRIGRARGGKECHFLTASTWKLPRCPSTSTYFSLLTLFPFLSLPYLENIFVLAPSSTNYTDSSKLTWANIGQYHCGKIVAATWKATIQNNFYNSNEGYIYTLELIEIEFSLKLANIKDMFQINIITSLTNYLSLLHITNQWVANE